MPFEVVRRQHFRLGPRPLKPNEASVSRAGLVGIRREVLEKAGITDRVVFMIDKSTFRLALRSPQVDDETDSIVSARHDKAGKADVVVFNAMAAFRQAGWQADRRAIFTGRKRLATRQSQPPTVLILLEDSAGTDGESVD